MADIYDTRVLVKEIEAILKANSDLETVSLGAVVSLSQETASTAVYISVDSVVLEPNKASVTVNAYDRHLLVSLYCNVNEDSQPLLIYDIADSIERSLLKDNSLWTSIVDRDIVAVNFDSQEQYPRRAATLLLDVRYRLRCE